MNSRSFRPAVALGAAVVLVAAFVRLAAPSRPSPDPAPQHPPANLPPPARAPGAQAAEVPPLRPAAAAPSPPAAASTLAPATTPVPARPRLAAGLPLALAGFARGTEVALDLPDAGARSGRVNLVQREPDGRVRIGGSLTGSERGTFSLAGREQVEGGRILLPERAQAYLITADAGGRLRLEAVPLSAVICFPLPGVEATAPSAPARGPVEVPLRSSRPTATAVLYLDFDGETVTDADWNGGEPIVAAAPALASAEIVEIWQRVKEDYWPFAIDVTTDPARYQGAPVGRRMRCIVTPTSAWFGAAGGVAYIDSFARAGTVSFSSTIPCWVFNSSVVGAAEAIAHELGHTFGLEHDGDLSQPAGSGDREYYHGHGTAPVSWAPIMGAGFHRDLVQWSRGEYAHANNQEDDLAIIANATNGFGLVPDEAGNDRAHAAALPAPGGVINQAGLISSAADIDFYAFTTAAGAVSLAVNPAPLSPNLDVALELQDAAGNVLASANPDTALPASLSLPVAAGTYFLRIRGTGRGSVTGDGYSNYGSIGEYTITGRTIVELPAISVHPVSQSAAGGATVTFAVTATSALPLQYQWLRNDVEIPGATGATLVLANVAVSQEGQYRVRVSNGTGSVLSEPAALSLAPRGLANFSLRTAFEAAAPELQVTFLLEGAGSRQMLVRAVGPALTAFGVSGALADPQLEIVQATTGAVVAANNDWGRAANAALVPAATAAAGAFALPAGGRDAAILASYPAGAYRVRPSGAGGTAGQALVEVYESDGAPRMAYVALRAQVGAGGLIAGFVVAGPGPAQYLLRAVGTSSLFSWGMLGNPKLSLYAGPTVLAMNDDWGNAGSAPAVVAAAAAVGAQSLMGNSTDAALLATLSPGAYSVRVEGVGGSTGVVLLEVAVVDQARAALIAPAIVSPPAPIAAGLPGQPSAAYFGVSVLGQPRPALQWRRNGVPIPGATGYSYLLPSPRATDAGSYDVVATNSAGSTTSTSASLAVNGVGNTGAHTVVGTGYVAGGTVTIANLLTYTGAASGLGWSVTLPPGWSFASVAMSGAPQVVPAVGSTGTLDFAWTTVPASQVQFTYTLTVPAETSGDQTLSGHALLRLVGNGVEVLPLRPGPLVVARRPERHSADTNRDGRISLFELTRVIELFNTRHGASRTGCYAVAVGTEDGYAPEPSRAAAAVVTLGEYHSADSGRDGKISLFELTRVIELFNYRSGAQRTGQYRVQAGSEDGFAPGP